MRRVPLAAGVLAASLVVPAGLPSSSQSRPQAAQQPEAPQVTFRLETDYVEVDAFVTAKDGTFVRDLTADDFEVFEDGAPQRIESLALVDIPFDRAEPPPPAEDVFEPGLVSNEGDLDGRIYLIVLDTSHVAALRTPVVKETLRRFVFDHVASRDRVAVVQIGRPDLSQDFTSNRRRVLDAIDAFSGEKLRSPALSKYEAFLRVVGPGMTEAAPPRDPEAQRRASEAVQTFDSLTRLANYMAGIQGRRKAVLFISEGIDLDLNDTIGPRPGTNVDLTDNATNIDSLLFGNTALEAGLASQVNGAIQNMVETATRASIAVYTVDPRGLADASDEAILFAGPPGQQDPAVPVNDALTTMLPTTALRRELRDSQQGLRSYAEQTGGLAIVGTNSFDDGFARIVRDNSTYYVLAYRTAPKYDGKFHEIRVRVKRPGVEIRARRGYYALKTKPAAAPGALERLLTSPMSMPGLTMHAAWTTLCGETAASRIQLTLELPGDELPFEERSGAFANRVRIGYLALDPDGTARAQGSKTLDLAFRPDMREAVAAHGLRYSVEIELPPGRYQMRMAASEDLGRTSGSVFWDLEVPDYASSPLAMTAIVLGSDRIGQAPAVSDAPALRTSVPPGPTPTRAFDLEDTITAFVEVYDNQTQAAHAVDLSVTVKTDDGIELFRRDETQESTAFAGPRRAYGYTTRILLVDLVPGRFVLTITASSRPGDATVTRVMPIVIR